MITCSHMDKAHKNHWLPIIFDLYYQNMHSIAPSSLSYSQERSVWLSEISPAVDKAPRQIILCQKDDQLIGYIQYYTRGALLMIEEFQICSFYQNTLLFHRMCRYLGRQLSEEIRYIEAFADIRNRASRNLMKKLGFHEADHSSPFVHLRADFVDVKKRFVTSR